MIGSGSVSSDVVMSPDERALRADLEAEPFVVGATAGRWRLDDLQWPLCVISVAAAPRQNAPSEFSLRFELSGYPAQAPTATPWDRTANQQLESPKLPAGRRAGHVFRRDNWLEGKALYAPYDRLAFQGHPDWPRDFPHLCWQSSYDITFYLEQVYELLHDEDYLGV